MSQFSQLINISGAYSRNVSLSLVCEDSDECWSKQKNNNEAAFE
jgi:hypothetical protein